MTVAQEVHHIKAKANGGTDDMSNLQAVAHACHVRLTIEESGGTPRPRVRIGLDGWPMGGGVVEKSKAASD